MAKASLEQIQQLREQTSMGMMDCKKAIEEAGGNMEKAVELLRKKGAKIAAKRGDNATSAGLVYSYIHPGSTVGVLVELNCETDFVARNDELKNFAAGLSMHIAAMSPSFLSPEEVDTEFLEKEKQFLKEELITKGTKAELIDKILTGKLEKLYSNVCLLQQKYVKDETGKLTIDDALKNIIGKVGENIKIRRFARFQIGS